VLDRMTEAYKTEYANVHRGCITSQCRRPKPMRAAAPRSAKFLNAGRNEEIVFTRNPPGESTSWLSSWGEPEHRSRR